MLEAALPGLPDSSAVGGMDQFSSQEPTPEFAAEMAEQCQRLLDRLGQGELRSVALWKMEGYSVDEIAAKLGCAPRTVDRKLWVIRSLWGSEAPELVPGPVIRRAPVVRRDHFFVVGGPEVA